MKVLDLFSGKGGFCAAFKERGHEVFTVDINKRFGCDLTADVLTLTPADLGSGYDIIIASPPCQCFSVASMGKHWGTPYGTPKTQEARTAMLLVAHTMELLEKMNPEFWLVENPRGMMRKLPTMQKYPRRTITYCQYGEKRMKPTDIWGVMPPTFQFRKSCRNGDKCHDAAPRGSKTGTQGIKGSADRAIVAYEFSKSICEAMEQHLTSGAKSVVTPQESIQRELFV